MKRLSPPLENAGPFGRSLGLEERRRYLLDASARLFEQRGFHGTSMQDIAGELGITKAALYHYVQSKDDLLHEIHEAFVTTMIEQAREHIDAHPDPVDQVRFCVLSIFRAVADHGPYVRAFFQDRRALEGEDWYRGVQAKHDEYIALVVDCLRRGAAAGVFALPAGPEMAARFLFGACNWSYQWLEPDGEIAPERLAGEWHAMLMRAFGATRP
jgi:TetR/AcrR family transcriptional regulator, cholesterol catabolism regulator